MKAEEPGARLVAGVMSGTSADGVDVALVRVSPGSEAPEIEFLGHQGFAYPGEVRAAVLKAMDADSISVAELALLNWRLGAIYADSIEAACRLQGVETSHLDLVGLHGQTVYHQAEAREFAGGQMRATWQIGEAAVVRERLGVPVVSDFRAADLAAGGQGAPLVPMLDFSMFRSRTTNRLLLNLGGIANVTVLPAGCGLADVVAFDTGPANMVMDALMLQAFGKSYDEDGATAERGAAMVAIVDSMLQDAYFSAPPPKSCGREQFGEWYAAQLGERCDGASGADLLATAAEVTVRSVAAAIRRWAPGTAEVIAAGGGVKNGYVMRRLAQELPGVAIRTSAEFGLEPQAKEAVAFALLSWLSWFGLAGNVSAATGAKGARVLGKISW